MGSTRASAQLTRSAPPDLAARARARACRRHAVAAAALLALCGGLLAGRLTAAQAQLRTAPRPDGINREVVVSAPPGGSAQIYSVGLRGGAIAAKLNQIDINISPLAAPLSAGLAQSDFVQLRLIESTNRTLGDGDDVVLNTVPAGSIDIAGGITSVTDGGNATMLSSQYAQGYRFRMYYIVADLPATAVTGHAFRLGTADNHIATSDGDFIGSGFAARNRDRVVVNRLIPVIGVSPSPMAFGSVPVHSSTSLVLTVSNTGAANLRVTSVVSTDGQFTRDIGRFTVAPGASQVVNVTFTPTAVGLQTADLNLTHNAPTAGTVTSVPMTGTGLSPVIGLTPSSLAFGSVLLNTPSALALTVSNSGNANLTVSSISSSDGSFVPSPTSFTVVPGGNQVVNVTFTPTVLGPRSATLSVVHNDQLTGSPSTVAMSGTGINPVISLSPAALAFGTVPVGGSSSLPLTVTNTGTSSLVVANATSSNPRFAPDIASFTVPPGGSQIVNVAFTPTTSGAQAGVLTLSHNAAGGTSTVDLSGTGAGAAISLSPASLAFGNVAVGTPSTLGLTVSNPGTAALNVTGITSSDGQYIPNPTTFSVPAGGSQVVNVTFTPTATGDQPASLSIAHNAAGSPAAVPLTGTGTSASVSLSPTTLAFGSVLVGSPSSLALTITNTGGALLTVSSVTSSDGQFAPDATNFTIAAGNSRVVNVTFTPSAAGSQAGVLTIVHDAAGSPATVPLTGTGIQPQISIAPGSLAFGNVLVGSGSSLILVVSNPGSATLSVSGTNSSDGQFVAAPTSYAVAPGANQTVTATFTPTSTGAQAGTLSIFHNAAGSPTAVSVGGTGIAPSFAAAPGLLSYGTVAVGGSSTLAVTVSNTGTAPLSVTSLSSDNSEFVPDVTAFAVAAGGSQAINVTFTPGAAGLRSGVLTFVHNAAGSPATVALNGTGTSPGYSVSPASLAFGAVRVGSSGVLVLTVSNPGNGPLSVSSISSDDGQFAADVAAFTVPAGGSQVVNVTFTPDDNGRCSGTLTIAHDAAGSPGYVAMTGTGGDPGISVYPDSLAYGNVVFGQPASLAVSVSNPGTSVLTVSDVSASDAEFTAVPTSFTVNPGAIQTVTVTYAASVMGSRPGFLFFSHDAAGGSTGIPLSASATVAVNRYSLNYGVVSSSADSTLPVVISNPSAAPVTVTSVVSDNAVFTPAQTTFAVPAFGTYTLDVTFRPPSPGQHKGHLRITHNPTIIVTLEGWAPSQAGPTPSAPKRDRPFEVPFGGEVLTIVVVALYGLFRRGGELNRRGAP